MAYATATSRQRVYQFHHIGLFYFSKIFTISFSCIYFCLLFTILIEIIDMINIIVSVIIIFFIKEFDSLELIKSILLLNVAPISEPLLLLSNINIINKQAIII